MPQSEAAEKELAAAALHDEAAEMHERCESGAVAIDYVGYARERSKAAFEASLATANTYAAANGSLAIAAIGRRDHSGAKYWHRQAAAAHRNLRREG